MTKPLRVLALAAWLLHPRPRSRRSRGGIRRGRLDPNEPRGAAGSLVWLALHALAKLFAKLADIVGREAWPDPADDDEDEEE